MRACGLQATGFNKMYPLAVMTSFLPLQLQTRILLLLPTRTVKAYQLKTSGATLYPEPRASSVSLAYIHHGAGCISRLNRCAALKCAIFIEHRYNGSGIHSRAVAASLSNGRLRDPMSGRSSRC